MIWLHLVYGTLMSRMLCLLTMVVSSRLGAFLRRLRIYTRPFGRFLKGLSSTAQSPVDLTFVSLRVSMFTWEKRTSAKWHLCTSMHGKRVLRLANTTWEPVPLVMPLSSLSTLNSFCKRQILAITRKSLNALPSTTKMATEKALLLSLAAPRRPSARNAITRSPRELMRIKMRSRHVRERRKVSALHPATMLLRLKKSSSNALIAVVEQSDAYTFCKNKIIRMRFDDCSRSCPRLSKWYTQMIANKNGESKLLH